MIKQNVFFKKPPSWKEGGAVRNNFERDPPKTIPAGFGFIWFSGFRGEYLNVKIYDVQQMQSDGNSSHGQSPCDLKSYFKIVCY